MECEKLFTPTDAWHVVAHGHDFWKGLSILPLSDVNLAEKGHSFNPKPVAVG